MHKKPAFPINCPRSAERLSARLPSFRDKAWQAAKVSSTPFLACQPQTAGDRNQMMNPQYVTAPMKYKVRQARRSTYHDISNRKSTDKSRNRNYQKYQLHLSLHSSVPLKPPLCMSLPHHISCDVMQSAKSIAHTLRQTRVDRTRTAGSFFWWYGSSHSLTRTRLDRSTVTKLNLPLTTAD